MRLRDGACVLNDLTKFNGLRASLTNLPNQFQINIECIVETQVAIANSYTLPITANLHFTWPPSTTLFAEVEGKRWRCCCFDSELESAASRIGWNILARSCCGYEFVIGQQIDMCLRRWIIVDFKVKQRLSTELLMPFEWGKRRDSGGRIMRNQRISKPITIECIFYSYIATLVPTNNPFTYLVEIRIWSTQKDCMLQQTIMCIKRRGSPGMFRVQRGQWTHNRGGDIMFYAGETVAANQLMKNR